MKSGPEQHFKSAPPRSLMENCFRMVLQVVAMWGFFLFLLPWGIISLQDKLTIPRGTIHPWESVALAAFFVAGFAGLTCGWSFVKHGHGTPLPLDQCTRLTITGLYRYVRNPMAILGVFQGLMVALYLGSWPVAVYSLMGAVFWELFARAPEERDLARRFGHEYESYRRAVRCWTPRLRPYKRVVCESKCSEQ